MASAPKARAADRLRSDFGQLSPAEQTLLDCCRTGDTALIGNDLPAAETAGNTLRATFVRFLLLGGDDATPVHDHGVMVRGGWLTGVLDLEDAPAKLPLVLNKCRIERIEAVGAELRFVSLDGSSLEAGMNGARLVCDGGVYLRSDFVSGDEINLVAARIGGDLDCQNGRFKTRGKKAPHSLSLHSLQVAGNLYFNGTFVAEAQVSLIGASIEGTLDCEGASFLGPGISLTLSRAAVEGMFFFHGIKAVAGELNVGSLRAAELCDDAASWALADGKVTLDNFVYGRFAGAAPADSARRIAWLDRQLPAYLHREFRPQPWEQLIAVLRAMGHPNEARRVAIAKQERLRAAGRVPPGLRLLHKLYGLLVGYGYDPARLVRILLVLWGASALAYWAAVNPEWFGARTELLVPPPRDPPAACLIARAAARRGDPCPIRPPDYANFVAGVYALDVLLPVVNLGYKAEWRPVVRDAAGRPLVWGKALRALYWLEIGFGWVAGLLLVGVLGNLVKKD